MATRALIQDRGCAVLTGRADAPLIENLRTAGTPDAQITRGESVELATWGGLSAVDPAVDEALLLTSTARRHESDLTAADARVLVVEGGPGLGEVLPTFAAVAWDSPSRVVAAADHLGFRQLYQGEGDGWAMLSTSSKAVATTLGSSLDQDALAVQSLLGWQLGQRSLFAGVRKLVPGGRVSLSAGEAVTDVGMRTQHPGSMELGRAVQDAAQVLRTYLVAYLEDHPDAGLQLTGGQDSRLLLSAVPPARRRGLRVVTLGAPGEPDVDMAASFASRYGMEHEILSLDGLDQLTSVEASSLCMAAARRLDYTTDPLAHAALTWAESRSRPGPRISGLGGEVARGFYYLGPPTRAQVSERRARRLASWRMFVNEAVPASALDEAFSSWAREVAMREVAQALVEPRVTWLPATDHLYLAHRMQRWAGATETAVCLDREIVNPMLDDRFITIAQGLSPTDKRGSRFLARLQLELDADLGRLPLEGRPPPSAFASRSPANSARLGLATAGKLQRKVRQRVRHDNRPPAGSAILAAKVVEHWRESPEVLEPVAKLGVFLPAWLDAVMSAEESPPPSAVALLVNLVAALS